MWRPFRAHIQALEDLNKPSVEIIIRKINALEITNDSDFNKYEALALVEQLVPCAQDAHHDKFTYYLVALQKYNLVMER